MHFGPRAPGRVCKPPCAPACDPLRCCCPPWQTRHGAEGLSCFSFRRPQMGKLRLRGNITHPESRGCLRKGWEGSEQICLPPKPGFQSFHIVIPSLEQAFIDVPTVSQALCWGQNHVQTPKWTKSFPSSTKEAEVRRMAVQNQPGKIVQETLS
jgi:hypothetical protein